MLHSFTRSVRPSSLAEPKLLAAPCASPQLKASKRVVKSAAHGLEDSSSSNGSVNSSEVRTLPTVRITPPLNSAGAAKLGVSSVAINLKKSAVQIQLESEHVQEVNAPWWLKADTSSSLFSSPPSSSEGSDTISDSSGEDDLDLSNLGWDRDSSGAPTISKASFEVLSLKENGSFKFMHKRRRDLLRQHRLQHRDFRRIDPSIDFNKTSPSITIKENALLICIGGVRALVTSSKALLFEPNSVATRKFFDIVSPHLKARSSKGGASHQPSNHCYLDIGNSHTEYMNVLREKEDHERAPPFEVVVLEGALLVATGQLDSERKVVANQVQTLVTNLPGNVTPVNLEELRRVKSVLVELETKADMVRRLLEELMDDDDEMRELNLSSRPIREERRRQREREKLNRELERAQEAKDQLADESADKYEATSSTPPPSPSPSTPSASSSSSSSSTSQRTAEHIEAQLDAMLSEQAARGGGYLEGYSEMVQEMVDVDLGSYMEMYLEPLPRGGSEPSPPSRQEEREREEEERERKVGIQEAQEALEELAEQEQEQEDIEEVEEVLEYYHQRAGQTESEAGRLLQGARDLEESIRVSLSAARYEVDRLELFISVGSFSAAIGAMFASIFGMNMRSCLEYSVRGFWATTAAIVLGCVLIFWRIMVWMRKRKII